MHFTVFGSTGFVGQRIVAALRRLGHKVHTPQRRELWSLDKDLGRVIYCIGITGDFRVRLHDTVEANVGVLSRLLKQYQFESWLYLSSTRVYGTHSRDLATSEETSLSVRPSLDAVYDLSKLLGESIVLSQDHPGMRVARIANIVGVGMNPSTFLGSILKNVEEGLPVTIMEDGRSSKDYMCVEDLSQAIIQIALEGRQQIYNLASGHPTSHFEIATSLERIYSVPVSFAKNGPLRVFPSIDVSRFREEFPDVPVKPGLNVIESLFLSKQRKAIGD